MWSGNIHPKIKKIVEVSKLSLDIAYPNAMDIGYLKLMVW